MRRKYYKNIRYILPVTLVAGYMAFLASGCQQHRSDEDQIKECADSFAVHYYNWHFVKAAHFCTDESRIWLRFAASNVQESDIDSLRTKRQDATVETGDITFLDDTTATIKVKISNFLDFDSLGCAAHRVGSARIELKMARHKNQWLVRMEDLPQSERQSHD